MSHTSSFLPIIIGVMAVLIFAGLAFAKRAADQGGSSNGDESVYQARPVIFSAAERSFLGVLESVLPPDVTYLGKIRLSDVFLTRKGLTPSRRTSAWNRINQKHVDFLLVRKMDFAPLVGIELDDKSHDAEDRRERDRFVDRVFASGNLPLLHVSAATTYNVAELRAKVDALLIANRDAKIT